MYTPKRKMLCDTLGPFSSPIFRAQPGIYYFRQILTKHPIVSILQPSTMIKYLWNTTSVIKELVRAHISRSVSVWNDTVTSVVCTSTVAWNG